MTSLSVMAKSSCALMLMCGLSAMSLVAEEPASSVESWSHWPWKVTMGAGSTIPHAVLSGQSGQEPLHFQNGVVLTLAGMRIESDAIKAWMSALPNEGPQWIERAQCTAAENGVVTIDTRKSELPGWRLRGLWQPKRINLQRCIMGTDQGNVLVELKLEMIDLKPFQCVMEGEQGSDNQVDGQAESSDQSTADMPLAGSAKNLVAVLRGDYVDGQLGPLRCHQIELLGTQEQPVDMTIGPQAVDQQEQQRSYQAISQSFTLVFNQLGELSRYVAGPDARFHIHSEHPDND